MIKTCPFCNSAPVVVYRKIFEEYGVRCDTPGCELEFAMMSCENMKKHPRLVCRTESEAIERWNTRFEPTMVEIQRRSW